jgi:UDP-N-acetylglucosamine 1-carboxyvinyltransferase
MHLKGLECMGAHITLEDGYVIARAENGLRGVDYTFSSVTVTGTENLLMAATLAKGTTRLINAAREPEVSDLARCLIAMGAKIEGVGTDTLIIEGCSRLHGAEHPVLPDRIETGTYAMAAALTGGEVELTDTSLDLIPSVIPALESMGVLFEKTERGFKVKKQPGRLKATDVETEPYPGFATDLQAQIMVLAATAEGASVITETIFENRFMHVPELVRMGADIKLKGNTAFIRGVPRLKGAPVMATDLRASVSLVLAGLAAEDETIVNRVYHLDRGYEHIEKKLGDCGANIERIHGEVV